MRNLPAVSDGEAQDVADCCDICAGHGGACRQDNYFIRDLLGLRQIEVHDLIAGAIWLHAVNAGVEVFSRENILGVEKIDKLIARKPGLRRVDSADHVLVIGALRFIVGDQVNARDAVKLALVLLEIAPVPLRKFSDAFQVG
jgi:hypothetical protein